ncbi:MAG TPA: Ni/Fe hydrogenase subunit alpha [Steroidobacteraceae bacterium]|nr:Ni/Fe hydrogenase subunit alpha [Steroidobacteraceae bacterium]
MATRTIGVELLARVEGEGALNIHIEDGRVSAAQLEIFEPPRFFEALLRGRGYSEAPDIAARICGICPIAYQLGAALAMEHALGVAVPAALRGLRRLIYCGEWIESHALHIVMLHAPDFLGYPDAVQMARDHGDAVKAGLAIKRTGNEIMRTLGGREIHPINVKVGGFHRIPSERELEPLVEKLEHARQLAVGILEWASEFRFPEVERDYEFVAMRHPQEYAIDEGRIVSSRGLDISIPQYDAHFEERQVVHSTALQSAIRGRGSYLVGPLARYNLNFDRLPDALRALARQAGLGETCRNPFKSILVRALEVVYACEEALRLIRAYQVPPAASIPLSVRAGTGHGCTEAPRGICHHRYEIDADGIIGGARIAPPTSQNQLSIEEDLKEIAAHNLDLADADLRTLCERAIRNYDPCISCSAHFLKLTVDRN